MNKEQKVMLLAMAIGDGYLCKDVASKSVSIRIKHSAKQKEYIKYKASLINSFCGGKQNKVYNFLNNGYPGCKYQKAHKYFRVLYKLMYKNGKKTCTNTLLNRLTPECFAIWWMDDGGVYPKRRNGNIHAWCGYLNTYSSWDENMLIADRIDSLFGVRPLLRHDKGSYRLEFNTTKLRILLPQIIHYSIPSMEYKFKLSTSTGQLNTLKI